MAGREIRIMKTSWLILKDKRGRRDKLTGGTGTLILHPIATFHPPNLPREMFVDTNRGMAVTMGEKDNKKAIDKRKKNLIKEQLKYGKGVAEEVELSWDHYYAKVECQIKG